MLPGSPQAARHPSATCRAPPHDPAAARRSACRGLSPASLPVVGCSSPSWVAASSWNIWRTSCGSIASWNQQSWKTRCAAAAAELQAGRQHPPPHAPVARSPLRPAGGPCPAAPRPPPGAAPLACPPFAAAHCTHAAPLPAASTPCHSPPSLPLPPSPSSPTRPAPSGCAAGPAGLCAAGACGGGGALCAARAVWEGGGAGGHGLCAGAVQRPPVCMDTTPLEWPGCCSAAGVPPQGGWGALEEQALGWLRLSWVLIGDPYNLGGPWRDGRLLGVFSAPAPGPSLTLRAALAGWRAASAGLG